MIIKNVPFYQNPDETHCYQAVFKMILKYFYPNRRFTWDKLDQLTGKQKDLWTWPQRGRINLKKMGFDVIVKEMFDYKLFSRLGIKYIKNNYGQKIAEEQEKHCDISQAMKDAEEYLQEFHPTPVQPTLNDILKLIDENYLVCCTVNAGILNNGGEYEGHFILIVGYDKNSIYVHDPGPPALAYKKVDLSLFNKVWEYPDEKGAGLEAYKL